MPSASDLQDAVLHILRRLTRHDVACCVAPIEAPHDLLPEEAARIANAVPARRREFAAGRNAARRALARVGGPAAPILVGAVHQPIWPAGFDGSITHDGRFAAAIAYAQSEAAPGLSLDLIDREDLAPYLKIAGSVHTPGEAVGLPQDARAAARLFSAKEAAIKIVSRRRNALVEFGAFSATGMAGGFHMALAGSDLTITVSLVEVDSVIIAVGHANPA